MDIKGNIEENGVRILAELGALKLSNILFGKVDQKIWDKFDYFLIPNITEYDVAKSEYEALIAAEGDISKEKMHLLNVAAQCSSEIALTLLELVMLRVTEPEISELLDLIAPGNGNGVTLLTAARVMGYTGGIDECIAPMKKALDSVRFLLKEVKASEIGFYRDVWRADTYLISLLSGGDDTDHKYWEYTERFTTVFKEGSVLGMKDEINSLRSGMEKLLENKEYEPFTVIISGERESGRYTLIKSVAGQLSLPLFAVDFSYLMLEKEPKEAIRYFVRLCALESKTLCLKGIKKHEDTDFLIKYLYKTYRKHCAMPLVLIVEKDVKLIPGTDEAYISVKIPGTSKASLELWKGFLPKKYKSMAQSLSSKMKLTAGQIKKVCMACETLIKSGEKIDEHRIISLCYEVLDDGRYDNVKWVEPGFTMDELKIDEQNMAVMNDIVNQVELRDKVYDEWGLKSRYAYGRCVSVILAGPPGTGKTMAVHALASRLGLELYKVDLSQIVDKYVGETEKRLEEVFTRAQKCNMILFFDEADAVMGKRSDVKDAQDKYANTEISFILQRIEEYDGIVILATNNIQNIDNAFMRRIRYVINFRLPEKEVREDIWRGAFSDGVPLSDDIDFEYLSETFKLSGGEIKNIVLNAVFYGASDGGVVCMKHIMRAADRELNKAKRVALNDYYGKYGYMVR